MPFLSQLQRCRLRRDPGSHPGGGIAPIETRLQMQKLRLSLGVDSAPVDPFAIVLLGGLVAVILWIWLLGKYYPGSGLEQLGLRSAREISESREALEAEDLDQMLRAHNARRRARGEHEMTVADLETRVMEDQRELRRRREAYLADQELDQLLEVTNARRRQRGLPERSRADVEREFGRRPPADS
jgi:hypothetical protein